MTSFLAISAAVRPAAANCVLTGSGTLDNAGDDARIVCDTAPPNPFLGSLIIRGDRGVIEVGAGATVDGGGNGAAGTGDDGRIVNAGTIESASSLGTIGANNRVTLINSGTIRNTAATSLFGIVLGSDAQLENSGQITSNGGFTVQLGDDGTVVNSGTITGGAFGLAFGGGGGVTNTGTIGGSTNSIRFAGTGSRLTLDTGSVLDGPVAGSTTGIDSLILQGTGSEDDNFTDFELLVMRGTDWTLSGTIGTLSSALIADGRLQIDGTLSTSVVDVESAGTLAGTGVVTGLVQNRGRVAPGASIGTLIVDRYAQDASGILEVELDPAGTGDQLVVLIDADLDGTLQVEPTGTGFTGGTTYVPVVALNAVNGQFATVTDPLPFVEFVPTYNADNVTLTTQLLSFSSGVATTGATTNQNTLASGLDQSVGTQTDASTLPNNTLPTSGNADFDLALSEFLSLRSDELEPAFNAVIAEPYAAFLTVGLEQMNAFRETVLDRTRRRGIPAAPPGRQFLDTAGMPLQFALLPGADDTADGATVAQLGGTEAAEGGNPGNGFFWADAYHVFGSVDGEDGLSGYDYDLTGVIFGFDYDVSTNVAVGGALGYSRTVLDDYELAPVHIDGNGVLAAAYAGYIEGPWRFAGLVGYGYSDYQADRRIIVGDIDRQAEGDFDSHSVATALAGAYRVGIDRYYVEPEAELAYTHIWQSDVEETGADSLNLQVDDANADALITAIGVRAGTDFRGDFGRIRPEVRLRYERDWLAGEDDDHDVVARFAAVPSLGSLDLVGQNPGADSVVVGGAVTFDIAASVQGFAGYDYDWRVNSNEHTLAGGVRVAW